MTIASSTSSMFAEASNILQLATPFGALVYGPGSYAPLSTATATVANGFVTQISSAILLA